MPSADEDEGEYTIVLPTSWENVTLLGKLSPDNGIDTDGDTLTDWQEADTKSGLISIDENGNVSLPSIKECLQLVGGKKYVDSLLAKISNGDNFRLWSFISPVRVLPVRSNPLREDTDSDGYSDGFDPDISKTPDILGKYYDFLDGEIYGLHARDIYAYFALSSQGDIIIDGEATVSTNDNVKYRFEWCGNGYRIHPISDESLSLTVVKEQGEYSVKALPTNYTDEQIWEVLPYNENRDASISYYGLLIRSKVLYYESFDSKGEALFLSYSSDKATVSTERITNVSIDLRDIADWTRFGKAYMQYEGWLDGKNDDVDRAIKNYVYNSKIIVASDSKVHHNYNNAYVYLLLHQDSNTFKSLIFGDNVKMSSVICEVMATYNAFVLKNIITNDTNFWGFYKLAVEFELSAKKINPFPDRENIPIVKDGRDGSFGCEPRDIENCLKAYRIKYLMYDKKDSNSSYKAAVQMNTEISINDIMIVAYGFDFLNLKIHTFSAACNGVNSLILFNRYTNARQTTSGNSILDSIGDKRHFRVGYILV